MTLTYDHLRLRLEESQGLTRWGSIGIFACVALLLVGGQFILPIWLLAAVPVVLVIGLCMMRFGRFALYSFITVVFALSFRITTNPDVDVFDLLAAACIGGVQIAWSFKFWVVNKEQLSLELPQTLFHLYFAFAILFGIGGVIFWGSNPVILLREVTVYAPLLVVPPLYVRFIGTDKTQQKRLIRYLFVVALLTLAWGGIRYVTNVAVAAYAYQIHRMIMDTATPTIFLLACVASALFGLTWLKPIWRLILSFFCFGAIVIANYRTVWVALAVAIVVMFFVAKGMDRKSGLKFLVKFGSLLGVLGTYLYLTVPVFKLFVMMQMGRFLSTAEITTDPSLYSRYVEYEVLWNYFLQSPIVGYGLGASFEVLDWLVGFTHSYDYSHNGFLFIAVKTGVIGFILLHSAYVGFIVKAYRLARDVQHSKEVRAVATIAVGYLSSLLITNSTLNIFGGRGHLLWIGLTWGFLLTYKIHRGNAASPLQEREILVQ